MVDRLSSRSDASRDQRTWWQNPLPSEPRRVLGWIYGARLLLAGVVLAIVLLGWDGRPEQQAQALFVAAAAAAVSILSYLHTHRRGRRAGTGFRYLQVAFDALFVTWLLYATGGQESTIAPFYILVLCAAALLLPLGGSLLVGAFVSLLYLAAIVLDPVGMVGGAVVLQVVLFAVVALVTSFLGDRLQKAGTRLGEVQTELQRLRLDTGEIMDAIGTGILTVDGEGRLIFMNPAARELLSLRVAEGTPILERLEQIAPGLGAVIERSARRGTPVARFETTDPTGEDAFILGVSTTVMNRGTEGAPAVTAIFQDITAKKRAEMLRRRAERLEAVAELSASLAHEIKNPLASIRSAVEQITGGGLDDEDRGTLRGLVVRESERLSRLLAEFIDFARVRPGALSPLSLNALLDDVVAVARAHPDAADLRIEVRTDPAAGELWVRGAEDLLHRAVLNLLLNALQWAPRGEGEPRIEIALDLVQSDLLSPAFGSLGLARLRIADSGPGVPDAMRDHIFDPFYTRRPGGTGLGLALVQRAVDAHGGAIFVDDAPPGFGTGALFTLYLPALGPDDLQRPAAAADAGTPAHKEVLSQ